jgi:hypothetical protein
MSQIAWWVAMGRGRDSGGTVRVRLARAGIAGKRNER